MAGLPGASNNVQTIVENVVNHPQFRSLITNVVETSNSIQSTPVCTGSIMPGPSGPGQRRSSYSTSTSTGNANNACVSVGESSTNANVQNVNAMTTNRCIPQSHSGPVEEFNAIFRRGGSSEQQQQGAGRAFSSFLPGRSSYTARSRSRSNSRGHRSSSTSTKPTASKTASKNNSIFTREVVLLNNSDTSSAVRGKKKAELMRNGQVISCFDFNRSWSEDDINQHLSLAFKDKLQGASFKIALGVGSELVEPNLMPDQSLDGERFSRLFTQKTVWLIPNINLEVQIDSSNLIEAYLEGNAEIDNHGIDPCESVAHESPLNDSPCTKGTSGQKEMEQNQLQKIFPGESPERIQDALKGNDITEAINYLLDDSYQECDWTTPLVATKIRKLGPLESLQEFIAGVMVPHAPEVDLTITREKSVIMQMLKKYKNPEFDLQSPINVQFISSGTVELGVDAGGPTRDLFCILMKELVKGSFNGVQVFEGEAGHLTPVFSYDLMSSHFFEMVGKMVLHSIINKCGGLEGISPAIASYIVSGSRDSAVEHLTVKDIPDPCLRDNLNELLTCPDTDLEKFVNEENACCIADILMSAGFPHLEISPGNRSKAYECCLTYEVITKRIPVLGDIRKGLSSEQVKSTTILALALIYPEIKNILFPEADRNIVLQDLRNLIAYEATDDIESTTSKEFLEEYLCDLNVRGPGEEMLRDLVQFWTGWPSLPMLGEQIKVNFLPSDANQVLAITDTCFKTLNIPTCHTEYKEFSKYMDISISHGKVGFGKM